MSTVATLSNDWKRNFYIFGHIAKGVVYSALGGVALAAVIGEASGPGGMKDVIRWIQNQPFGQILLVLIAIGLFSYCAWRWIKSLEDTGNEGNDAEGLVKRTGYAASGTAYGLLGVYAITLLTGSSSGGSSKQDMLGQILQESWGQIVVGIIALILVGVGIYQLNKGLKEKYMEDINHTGVSSQERQLYRNFGKAGFISRSVVYGIMAYFLGRVALTSDPSQYRGVEGVLEYLGGQTMGTILVALVALGLLLYGLFMFVKAKYPQVS
ncbi:DUF1206 domain-containing protein [Flavilitoribacter nigricans]|uniref:DUF1206 domain-containing protein n=1 Tax=Flavilitoribacter nigricans (strain ATCC 23147 / DSM 23189 / NBRC 102662 / NCIMB 1420 / SS-2) TaxID=1122177 RepID=A0A2D0N539_FLAN2|nr:DUF1206 domain-containing protein [Flavilitoribacter nigricans]PHN03652.1 hypothetical protein CRP01_25720 [Flavilitoribacter nigricans DSM 23189 = NBRC 102662]